MQKASSNHKLFAGTSGWSYSTWKPDFYPKSVPAKKFLEFYGTQLNTVEVNYTFRALPSATQMENWLASVPNNFRFSFKAPQALTHTKRLKDCAAPLEAFWRSIAAARSAKKFGCVLFQLPPNFKVDRDRLRQFLELPQCGDGTSIAFEFRHESWLKQEIYDVLQQHNAAVCIAESENLVTPESFTANFSVYRLRMPDGYNAKQVKDFAGKFSSLASKRETYVYFKHEDQPTGPLAATAMLHEAHSL